MEYTLTPEQIAALHDRNENFEGKRADFTKMQLYKEIKADLTDFLQCCPDVMKLTEMKPNKQEQNALLFLDMKPIATLDKQQAAKLAEVMRKADRVFVSALDGKGIRYSFAVEKVWSD